MLLLTTVIIIRLSVKENPSDIRVAKKPFAYIFYVVRESCSSEAY